MSRTNAKTVCFRFNVHSYMCVLYQSRGTHMNSERRSELHCPYSTPYFFPSQRRKPVPRSQQERRHRTCQSNPVSNPRQQSLDPVSYTKCTDTDNLHHDGQKHIVIHSIHGANGRCSCTTGQHKNHHLHHQISQRQIIVDGLDKRLNHAL